MINPPYFHLGAEAEAAMAAHLAEQQRKIDEQRAAAFAMRNLAEVIDE